MASPEAVLQLRSELSQALDRYLELESRLRELEADDFRVCIFGSARLRPGHRTYQTVRELARMLGDLGIDVVTGGGPGLMEAANQGVQAARRSDASSFGVTIDLPLLRERANRHLDIKSEHRRFSSRLDEFMRLSELVIVAPGGIGTLLELVYVWQLVQVRMIPPRPLILLGEEYWRGLLAWMRQQMLAGGFVGARDFDWIQCVETPDDALKLVKPVLEAWVAAQEERKEGRDAD